LTEAHNLSRIGWLSEQPQAFRERLAEISHWRRFAKGESFYEVGDPPNGVFGLELGRVEVSLPISDDEMVAVHRAGPGLWFGEAAIISDNARGVSVHAQEECLALFAPADRVRRLIADHPEDMILFAKLSFATVMLAIRVLSETIALPPRARFARHLLRQAEPDGSVRATQTELAGLGGMSRSSFRRALAELISTGVLRMQYGAVRILDRAALERVAEDR